MQLQGLNCHLQELTFLTVQAENESGDIVPTHEELSTYAEKRKTVDMEVKANNVNEVQKRQ